MDRQTEKKWFDRWEKEGVFKAEDFSDKPKFYGLVEFPYPSGYGLHMGHMRAYTSMEVIARMKRLQGYNVLFPIGYDAFGLPSENYAIKTGIAPQITNQTNINHMREQLKSVGFSFDYDREIDTTDPEYYKWTQWIFLKMFEKGLAYRSNATVNYCESCKCVLSNEESQGGKCDRCGSQVVQKNKKVWFLKITDYAEELLKGIDELECNDAIKDQMRNWIGKSTGAEINFETNAGEKICVYTTRPDTIFGVTFLVVNPEHEIVAKCANKIKNLNEVKAYQTECKTKTEFERLYMNKDKTGVKLEGIVAYNPLTKKEITVFIADYVLNGYGTGAIMAVPAHDDRDYDFAKKFNSEIIEVILGGDVSKEAYTNTQDGILTNSEFLNGLNVKQAKEVIVEKLEQLKIGKRKTNYNMKDWAFNRQRYWGEPIPIVYCEKCGTVAVPENELPLTLPMLKEFKPGENGESPLAKVEEFVNCKCPKCGGPAKRETDTMPQWAGSSWYYLRYMDPKNKASFADYNKLKYWGKVDWYNGGMEHVTRHLLYSRFWNEFLYDQGLVPNKEPYSKRTAVGLVLGENGQKMSKSQGNVVDPDALIAEYGADVARLYTMFIGDYEKAAIWSSANIVGCKRFLEKVERLCTTACETSTSQEDVLINKTIKKITEDTLAMKFNTAIACMFEFVNQMLAQNSIKRDNLNKFLLLLYPYAPFSAEEFNEKYLNGTMLAKQNWPICDESKMISQEVEIPVQINGRVRGKVNVLKTSTEQDVIALVENEDFYKQNAQGKQVAKVIYVQGKIINIILK